MKTNDIKDGKTAEIKLTKNLTVVLVHRIETIKNTAHTGVIERELRPRFITLCCGEVQLAGSYLEALWLADFFDAFLGSKLETGKKYRTESPNVTAQCRILDQGLPILEIHHPGDKLQFDKISAMHVKNALTRILNACYFPDWH